MAAIFPFLDASIGVSNGDESAHAVKPTIVNKHSTVAFRPVAPPDERFLIRLYATTRMLELARTGWDETERDTFIRSQYQARRADYAARYLGAEHSIILINGEDAGAWMIWRAPIEIRLVNIELLPVHQGQGVGSTLIRQLMTEAKHHRLPVSLSVRDDNPGAARLYRRLGFSITGRDHGYLRMQHKP